MNQAEFDKFADEYRSLHAANIRLSGEGPDYFARYKVQDVAQMLGPDAAGTLRILDFGSGVGASVRHFRQLLPQARLTCLDVSARSLDIGRQHHRDEADFVGFDGRRIPFPDGSFDLVFAACVFHHIDAAEHDGLLAELRRCLRPGGHCVIFEHNPFNPLTVRAVNTCPFDENAVLIPAASLVKAMRRCGFRDVVRRYRIFFPAALRRLRGLEPFVTWLPLGAQYCVVGVR